MKKVIAACLIITCMLLLSFSVNAENQINEETVKKITENEKIEISFKVGENLLKINGENI